jgi:ribonuclease G
MQNLLSRWDAMCKITDRSSSVKILGELNRASSILRDVLMILSLVSKLMMKSCTTKQRIICKKLHLQNNQLLSFINQMIHPFLKYNIERQIKTSFGKTVSMSKGAYLIIEHTEALHVIDVNSGNRSNKASNQEDTAMEVNMIAAAEIARQLRLRDMGGIIVIDFID